MKSVGVVFLGLWLRVLRHMSCNHYLYHLRNVYAKLHIYISINADQKVGLFFILFMSHYGLGEYIKKEKEKRKLQILSRSYMHVVQKKTEEEEKPDKPP